MSFVKKILETEEKARNTITLASEKAKKLILDEQEAQKKIDAESLMSLKENRTKQVADQKKKLVDIYKEELAKGQKDIARIQKKTGSNHEKAVLEVLNSLTS